MRTSPLSSLALIALLGGASELHAADFCVSTSSGLEISLGSAANNGGDDVVRVRTGTYDAPTDGFKVTMTEDNRLEILGGYTDVSCSERTLDPTNTVLRGTIGRTMAIQATQNTVVLEGFTLQDGDAGPGASGGGLLVNSNAGSAANVEIRSNIFRDNIADTFGGGISGGSDGGDFLLRNNLFVGNSAGSAHGAASLTTNGANTQIVNNTVTGNLGPDARGGGGVGVGGLRIGGSSTVSISNNIFWGNDGADLVLDGGGSKVLSRNDIETLSGTPTFSFDDISVDPLFEGGDSYRPVDASPVNDRGLNNPAGGVAALDLDGRDRVIGNRIDLGAYESDALLLDGFESGDADEWDAAVP